MRDAPAQSSALLSMDKVSLSFGDKRVLDDLSFSVAPGECFGLLGPSGAGKTTTLKLLTRQLVCDAGQIELFGSDIAQASETAWRRIGILSDTSALYERMSIEANLRFYAKIRGVDARIVPKLLGRMGLTDDRKTLIKNCSKGMRQRATLAATLIHKPALLFLDEPTSGLDPATRVNVHDLLSELKRGGTTVFLTTHDMAEADALCDRVGILCDGRLVACDAPEMLSLRFAKNEIVMRTSDGRVHHLTKDAASARTIAAALEDGTCLSLHSIEPNLEDVFLQLTGRSLR